MPEYNVKLAWDNESNVWIATSDQIDGLVLECGSIDALIQKVKFAIPELLSLNAELAQNFSICFRSEWHEMVRL